MKNANQLLVAGATLLIGLVLVVVGLVLLADVGELRDRTEQAVGVVTNDQITYTTQAGAEYTITLASTCKRAEPPPRRGCIEHYETGDELIVTYDTADPTHTWEGATPGGGWATGTLYAGIVILVISAILFYAELVLPRIKAANARLREITGRSQRPGPGASS